MSLLPLQLPRHPRPLVVAETVQFAISAAILLVASLGTARPPLWVGLVDAVLAFTLVIGLALLHATARAGTTTSSVRAAYLVSVFLVPAACLAMWVFRTRLDFNVLLPGLAWRSIVLLYGLPAAVTVWRGARKAQDLPGNTEGAPAREQ